MDIKAITVIGANGTMGKNISAIFASFGNAKVYMVCRSLEKAKSAANKASKCVKADAIRNNLVPADYTQLPQCVSQSDLVFESVAENQSIKENINKQIAKYATDHTIISTGTSGLSINRLASCLPDKLQKKYLGLHMYNPPYSMTLCELIPSKSTEKRITEEMHEYASKKLYRTVVEVKDTPAFLGNRIGFQFINEALQYAEKYKDNGGIDYIDSILGQFTGRSMPPLATSDFVGLDVHKAIVDNIYHNTDDYAKETFRMPTFADKLVREDRLGRKAGEGLYKIDASNVKRINVYDIASGQYREKMQYVFPFAENMISALKCGDYRRAFLDLEKNQSMEAQICFQFILKYVLYSLVTSNAVGDSISNADDVMATGFSWAPPLSIIQALGDSEKFKSIVNERVPCEILSKIDLEFLLYNLPISKYDYRRYFRAKH